MQIWQRNIFTWDLPVAEDMLITNQERNGQKNPEIWKILPQEEDWETSEKARSARVFYSYWKMAREDKDYLLQKERFVRLKAK